MTKLIALLRHGEAEYGQSQHRDFSRNLSASGKSKLKRLSNVLKERGLHFDAVVSSSAARTRQTTEIMLNSIEAEETTFLDSLYLADVQTIIDFFGNLPEKYCKVLFVGHNPSISAFLSYVTGEYHMSLQPGMMTMVDIEVDSWEIAINRGMGNLTEVLQ